MVHVTPQVFAAVVHVNQVMVVHVAPQVFAAVVHVNQVMVVSVTEPGEAAITISPQLGGKPFTITQVSTENNLDCLLTAVASILPRKLLNFNS